MNRSRPKGGWFIDLAGGYKGEGETNEGQSCFGDHMFARWSSLSSSSSSSVCYFVSYNTPRN